MKKVIVIVFSALVALQAAAQPGSAGTKNTNPVVDTVPPYKKNPSLPPFKLLQADSTWFTNMELAKKKPVVIIYFSPECGHCQLAAQEMTNSIDKLKDATFLWVSYYSVPDIAKFVENYHLAQYRSDPLAKLKQSFTNLGKALDAGSMSDAQRAFAQLQQNAPAQSGQDASARTTDSNNPLTAKVDALSKAVSAGDLKSAQSAYADLKQIVSQGPPAGARPPGGTKGGAPTGSGGGQSGTSALVGGASSGSSSTSTTSTTTSSASSGGSTDVSQLQKNLQDLEKALREENNSKDSAKIKQEKVQELEQEIQQVQIQIQQAQAKAALKTSKAKNAGNNEANSTNQNVNPNGPSVVMIDSDRGLVKATA